MRGGDELVPLRTVYLIQVEQRSGNEKSNTNTPALYSAHR